MAVKSLLEKEVVEGTHSARQGQKTAAGTRPAPLEEVARSPGFWPAAPRQPGHGAPSLAPPSLAAPANEGVDTAAVRFLLGQNLKRRQEEEALAKKEEAKKEKETVMRKIMQSDVQQQASVAMEQARLLLEKSKRKRKKRRKRKLPKTFSLRRPCVHWKVSFVPSVVVRDT